MALTRAQKETQLARIQTMLKSDGSIVFVSFGGLSVADATTLRRSLSETGSGFTVVKKTLLKRSLASSGVSGTLPDLPGELAISYGADLIAPAKSVAEFQKKFADKVRIVGGIFNGAYRSIAEMEELARTPGRHELLGMFVNVINSPIQGLVIALDSIAKSKTA